MSELGLTWTEAWITVVTAVVIYAVVVIFSRMFGQRQFSRMASYDLPFIFAMGSIVGRVVLVRTSLAGAVLGISVMFLLHAASGWLHHHSELVHRLTENRPILVVLDGELLDDNVRRAHTSALEIHEQVRMSGAGTLERVRAVVLERNGAMSVIGHDGPMDAAVFQDVVGGERLA